MKEIFVVTLLFILVAIVVAKTQSKNSGEILIGKPLYKFLSE